MSRSHFNHNFSLGESFHNLLPMALFGKVLEPVGLMQTMKVLVQGICSYLDGSASTEDLDVVKKNLDHIDQELGSFGPGLIEDAEVHRLEDDLVVVYNQLCTAIRAQPEFTKQEREVFLEYVREHQLERQLTALYSRMMGISALTHQPTILEEVIRTHRPKRWEMKDFCVKVNFVLGTGLLCLFTQAALAGRDQALLIRVWSERMAALYRKMKTTGGRCSGYFLEQAQEDIQQQMQEALCLGKAPEEQADAILKTVERNYDWLRWGVMVHPAITPWEDEFPAGVEKEKEEVAETTGQENELKEVEGGGDNAEHTSSTTNNAIPPPLTPRGAPPNNLLSVSLPTDSSPSAGIPSLQVVACYRESPATLDKARIHQLIVDLEWKIPNPPPEVYTTLEAEPERARHYLASRMLRKLREGLGDRVAVHVVPGHMEVRANFPQASFYQYQYKHRLASGTVCIFG